MWSGFNVFKSRLTASQAAAFLKRHKEQIENAKFNDYRIQQVVFEVIRSHGCNREQAVHQIMTNLMIDNRMKEAEEVNDWFERERMI